jgi:hypothetical protein
MVGITVGHRAPLLRPSTCNWTRRQPIRVTDHANTSRECPSGPDSAPEIPHIPGLDSIKHLSAEYGGTVSTMMWRNGRLLSYGGGAALF